jgi:transposase-like protein
MSSELETDLSANPANPVTARPFEPDYPGQRNPWDRVRHPTNYWYIQRIIERVDAEDCRPPKYSEETKLQVYSLRDQGYTLRQIAEAVGVSKSTACLYIQKLKKQETQKVAVKQPGTDKVVESVYSLNEVKLGKISTNVKVNKLNEQ